MYRLYWEKLSGSIGPHVMLEEIGANYELKYIDMGNFEHRSQAYKAICPSMRIPALELEDGPVIGETAAIMLTLGDRHPDAGLVPALDDHDRPEFLYWLLHMATQGYPVFSRTWHPEQFTDDPTAEAGIKRIAEQNLATIFASFEAGIKGRTSFLKRGFSCLDIYLTMLTLWIPDRPAFLSRHPRIAAVCHAVAGRPSFEKVVRMHGLLDPAEA
ncbi:glutathione S-transferase family protein [Roseovarius aestuariivivens]|uniref:glutathione S-transferase family protein n=1 Tax=Roseovarius aestuariivivens TaxID=1888910 RepID=UPI0010809EB0|nr:glutathione S-transferase family protein [Roseovarius aestuariivivens]